MCPYTNNCSHYLQSVSCIDGTDAANFCVIVVRESWYQIGDGDVIRLNVIDLVVAVKCNKHVHGRFAGVIVLQFEDKSENRSQSVNLSREFQRVRRIG